MKDNEIAFSIIIICLPRDVMDDLTDVRNEQDVMMRVADDAMRDAEVLSNVA